MSLIRMQDACLSYSNLEILKKATLQINKHERICLMGKNGAGKSTLLKIIAKKQDLDSGKIIYQKNLTIDYLKQGNPNNLNISIYNFISNKINSNILSKNFINIPIQKKKNNQSSELNIDNIIKIKKIIEKLKLNKNALLSELSGGLIRKAALGRILLKESDVLLLDEPTNHLDIDTVKWLENFLIKCSSSILFVSHDRSFTQNICTRIIDLDRGKIISWPGNYNNFVKLKAENIRIEDQHKKIFDQNLNKEEIWIRKSIKARCTRNEGRVKHLKMLRKTSQNYKKIEKIKNIQINQINNYTGKIIFKIKKIHYSIDKKIIINNFSSTIQHGDKIGLIGNNGCGKSTLIKIIIGKIKAQKGDIYIGKGLEIVYFDQNRSILNPNQSIIENMDCGTEKIILNGKERSLVGYLKDFLFKSNQIHSLVKTLSGGECNRLLLAKIFLKPSNVLILDEPTNDLDLDTLQLLENIIINYKGTVLVVSHDRTFINNTVNKYWIFKQNGYISNCLNQSYLNETEKKINNQKNKKNCKIKKEDQKIKIKKNKNNMIQINKILNSIEKIELKIEKLQNIINQPKFFTTEMTDKIPILNLLSQQEKKLKKYLKEWEILEKM